MTEPDEIRLTLLECTIDLLVNRPRKQTLPEIAKAIGVSTGWLNLLINGRTKSPNVDAIQRLYEYLKNEPLKY